MARRSRAAEYEIDNADPPTSPVPGAPVDYETAIEEFNEPPSPPADDAAARKPHHTSVALAMSAVDASVMLQRHARGFLARRRLRKIKQRELTGIMVIQRVARGCIARRRVRKLRIQGQMALAASKAAIAVNKLAMSRKQNSDRGLAVLRILKPTTIALRDLEYRRSGGSWRYEIVLDRLLESDVGNLLVGWGSDVLHNSWEIDLANSETPIFDSEHPTRWWGPVVNRAGLASDLRQLGVNLALESGQSSLLNTESAPLVFSVIVDVEKEQCWYNIFLDTTPAAGELVEDATRVDAFKWTSVCAALEGEASAFNADGTQSRWPGGWKMVKMEGLRPRGESGAVEVYPVFSLTSSENLSLNFGQQAFYTPLPSGLLQDCDGLVGRTGESPVRARKLVIAGGAALSIDYNEKMPRIIEAVAQRGLWDQMKMMLGGNKDDWAKLKKELDKTDQDGSLDPLREAVNACAESLALFNDDVDYTAPSPHELLRMTDGQSKTLIHLAIENKRLTFISRFFDWLPPREDREAAKMDKMDSAKNDFDREKVMEAERHMLTVKDLDGCNPLLFAILNSQTQMASRILEKAIDLDKEHASAHAWRKVGEEKPTSGEEITNKLLANELENSVFDREGVAQLLPDRLDKLGIENGLRMDHYIKVGMIYCQPAEHIKEWNSITSRIATQRNEEGQAALWAAIESKSQLALQLVHIKDVNNNRPEPTTGMTPLMRAIEMDNQLMFDALLAVEGEGQVELGLQNKSGFTAVTLASFLPDREAELGHLLAKADERGQLSDLLRKKSSEAEGQRTALMYAIDSENTAAAKMLISYYNKLAEVQASEAMDLANVKSATGASALLIAIDERNAEVVEALVALLSKEALKEKFLGKDPLEFAIKAADEQPVAEGEQALTPLSEAVVEKLVDARFASQIADQNDEEDVELLQILLDKAVKCSLYRVVKRLLYQGAKPSNAMTAAAAGDIEYFERDNTIVPNDDKGINRLNLAEDDSGSTFLMIACRAGNETFVSYLLDRFTFDIVADARNRDTGETAIITAARQGYVKIVKKLIAWAETEPKKRGNKDIAYKVSARPATTVVDGKPALRKEDLYKDGKLQIENKTREQVSHGDRLAIDVQAFDGTNVLMAVCAISAGSTADAKELVDVLDMLLRITTNHIKETEERSYKDKNRGSAKDDKGLPPSRLKLLRKEWANLTDMYNDSALDLAVRHSNIELAMSLRMSWGATTSFRSAAVIGSKDEFRVLMDAVSAVNECDPRGQFTALHLSCRSTQKDCDAKTSMLLDRSADPSLQTSQSYGLFTPLMFACMNANADGKVVTVQALLDAHANPDLQNADGATALILTLKDSKVYSPQQMQIAALLVGAGANILIKDLSDYSAQNACSQIAGELIAGVEQGELGEETSSGIATMINNGVYIYEDAAAAGQLDAAQSLSSHSAMSPPPELQQQLSKQKQRGFILPDGFDMDAVREDGTRVLVDVASTKRSVMLRAYVEMSAHEIARCASYVFMNEGLFAVLMKGMWLSHLANREAQRVMAVDENLAGGLRQLANRVQLSVAGCFNVPLQTATKVDDPSQTCKATLQAFLSTYEEGNIVLQAASKYEMKAVLAHPEIQRYTHGLWLGWIHRDFIANKARPPADLLISIAIFLNVLLQILLSPFIAVVPFVVGSPPAALKPVLGRIFGVPIVDFWAATLSHIAFIVLLVLFPSRMLDWGWEWLDPQFMSWFLTVWALSDFWTETLELTDGFSWDSLKNELLSIIDQNHRSEYLIDPFNIFDFLSSFFVTIGLLSFNVWFYLDNGWEEATGTPPAAPPPLPLQPGTGPVIDFGQTSRFDATHYLLVLLSIGVFFGWWRVLRLLSMGPRMGPFVLMFIEMFSDIFQWLILLAILLSSTSSALYILHDRTPVSPGYTCNFDGDGSSPFRRFDATLIKIIEGSLIGDPYFECMLHNSHSDVIWFSAWLIAVMTQVVVSLLLVNMLIAKMAKTFDSIWENQGVNFMYLYARTCLAWDEAPVVCSPFIALSWPCIFMAKLLSVAKACCGVDSISARFSVTKSMTKSRPKRSKRAAVAPDANAGIDLLKATKADDTKSVASTTNRTPARSMKKRGTTRSLLTSVGERNQMAKVEADLKDTPDSAMSEAEITAVLVGWILDHEAEVDQSKSWRTQMQKKTTRRFDDIDKGIAVLNSTLKEVKRGQLANFQMQDQLTQVQEKLRTFENRLPAAPP